MKSHLLGRCLDPASYPTSLVHTDVDATFLLWDFSGRLCGYQVYNPSYPKNHYNTPRECRYFTYSTYQGVWGLEFPLKGTVFVVEGVFDAARLHSLGHSAIAVLGNNPLGLKSFFECLPYRKVALCDGDKAGLLLASLAPEHEIMPDGEDVSSLESQQLNLILEKYL